MTLAEIREKYGVPAEVGMRVSLGGGPARILRASTSYPGQLVIYREWQSEPTTTRATYLTYYNADGEVIWRPGQ